MFEFEKLFVFQCLFNVSFEIEFYSNSLQYPVDIFYHSGLTYNMFHILIYQHDFNSRKACVKKTNKTSIIRLDSKDFLNGFFKAFSFLTRKRSRDTSVTKTSFSTQWHTLLRRTSLFWNSHLVFPWKSMLRIVSITIAYLIRGKR